MIARYSGASLGLLAFTITMVAGLVSQNSATTTLSRSIFALFLFFMIGLVVGAAADIVIRDYAQKKETGIHERYAEDPNSIDDAEAIEDRDVGHELVQEA